MSSTASKLASLRGLDGAKFAVERLLSAGSESHAVLFYGAPGAGKRSLATALAQAWLCTNVEDPGCGECRSCIAFERGSHADILQIKPIGLSSMILVRQVRDVPTKPNEEPVLPIEILFRVAPLVSHRKVVVIESADRMNESAANALLKMLEEPPPFGRLILTTSSVRRLPSTILSRCLAVACELPEVAGDDADLWRLAGGAPGRVAQIESRGDAYRAIDRFAQSLPLRLAGGALVAADEFRALSEALESGNARATNTEALATLATAIQHHHPDRPEWAIAAVEAHRRIVGNGSAAYALDALFGTILV